MFVKDNVERRTEQGADPLWVFVVSSSVVLVPGEVVPIYLYTVVPPLIKTIRGIGRGLL